MLFEQYRAAGICVIPLRKGVPAVKWGQYQKELPSAEVVATWSDYDEYALVCGSVSGIVAVDIDTDDAVIIDKIYRFLPQSPVNKLGSKGFTAFYRYNGEKTKSWGRVVEVLSDKHLTTLPPSKHREKKLNYEWVDGVELIGAELPTLPDNFYEFMEEMYPTPVRLPPPFSIERFEYGDVTLDDAARALKHIKPDIGRDEWVAIGMALRDEFGDAACGMFHEWSSKSKDYNARKVQSEWRSFNGNGITIATLFGKAKLGGWHPEPIVREAVDTSLADAFVGRLEHKKWANATTGKAPEDAPPPIIGKQDEFDPMALPGLIGDTVRWICSDAMFPQPMLALLHTLAFAGAVFGRTYASPINTRTNVYFAGIANTTAGKNHSRVKLPILAEAAGLTEFLGAHGVISDTGIARSLMDNPCQMLMTDEWGMVLQAISDKKAPPHSKKIKSLLMTLYSDSGSVYKHGDYANKKVNEPVIIHSPNLCVYGTTTETEYLKALSKDAVASGELNRVMAIRVDSVEPRRVPKVSKPPQDLIDRWERFSRGNFAIVTNGTIKVEPKTVGWGDCDELQWHILLEQHSMINSADPAAALWGRRYENIIKVAMMFAIARNKEVPEMQEQDFAIGKWLVDKSVRYMASLIGDKLPETDHEAALLEVLAYVQKVGARGVVKSDIIRKFRKYKARDLNDMLSSLIEQGAIEAEKIDGVGGRPSVWFIAR